jgi:hypothetical protein
LDRGAIDEPLPRALNKLADDTLRYVERADLDFELAGGV